MSNKFTTQREGELHKDLKLLIEMISTSKHISADLSLMNLKVKAIELKEKHSIK